MEACYAMSLQMSLSKYNTSEACVSMLAMLTVGEYGKCFIGVMSNDWDKLQDALEPAYPKIHDGFQRVNSSAIRALDRSRCALGSAEGNLQKVFQCCLKDDDIPMILTV